MEGTRTESRNEQAIGWVCRSDQDAIHMREDKDMLPAANGLSPNLTFALDFFLLPSSLYWSTSSPTGRTHGTNAFSCSSMWTDNLRSKFPGKDLYNTTGVDVKFGMNTYLHCSICFLIRQKPVIEKYQTSPVLSTKDTGTFLGVPGGPSATAPRCGDSLFSFTLHLIAQATFLQSVWVVPLLFPPVFNGSPLSTDSRYAWHTAQKPCIPANCSTCICLFHAFVDIGRSYHELYQMLSLQGPPVEGRLRESLMERVLILGTSIVLDSSHELFRKRPADSQHFKGHSQNEYVVGISMTVSQPGEPKACCKIDVSISHA
ncbi:hypothetical protein E5288_WYG012588 [Bos mutus]|uniref:Uncharacterized protein n=1 Tax=Bos mutus TaxID=72004 RepID=A0A6B0RZ86_9CETA|nr:hypothetical protein [Bos mutus]